MKLLWLKIKTSLKAIVRMYKRHPGYIALTLGLFAIILTVLLWIFNLSLLYFIFVESGLGLQEKLEFVLGIYQSIATNFDAPQAIALVLFAGLFSINLTMLVFVIRTKGKMLQKGQKGASGLSAVFAIIASGCAACGTSILTPILLSLGAGSSAALSRSIGVVVSYLSLLLVVYSIYSLGSAVANTLAIET